MAVNRGKQFEDVIKESFLKVPNVSIDRLHDQTTHWKGSKNICDFIVYKEPYEYYIECKSTHGNVFSFSKITDNQLSGLLKKSDIKGVVAGVIIWFVDKDVTMFVPIQYISWLMLCSYKSIRYDHVGGNIVRLCGKKKRVFFDYDMGEFFNEVRT